MSGIVGFNWDNSFLVRKMCQSIKHRGPDQESFFSDSNVSLGHNKLWLPVDKAKYPIKNEDNSIFLVADARVYNHQELRKDLEKKGHKFSTQSDNEVIVHAYEEYGDECVQLFNGQFAFCIYDGRQKKFLLARDRAGIRPLYYYWKDGKFIFASELKAILEHDVKREIDIESIRFYLSHGVVPCPRSIFNDIYKLSPANMMIVKDG
ncbi:DUF1933 domain-containing protein, partial [Candidatus Woesearchaeota archaeon]|nr:DUF1933 domain-containing protein [Candidatus Woesearchaeota archaeon]